MTSEEALGICLVLLHVTSPLLFTVTSFPDTPTNKLAAPSPSLKVYHCNKRDMQNLHEQNYCFCTKTFYFHWPNFLSVGIVNTTFQSAGTGKYTTPTGHLNFHFAPFVVSYSSHGEIKDIWISFPSNTKVHSKFFSEEFRVSYFRKKSCQVAVIMCLFKTAGTCYRA